MFKAAGLTAPTTWAQVLTDANKLTTKSVSGICIRGAVSAPNGYPVLLMLPYFLPYAANYKGEYLNANWKPSVRYAAGADVGQRVRDLDAEGQSSRRVVL